MSILYKVSYDDLPAILYKVVFSGGVYVYSSKSKSRLTFELVDENIVDNAKDIPGIYGAENTAIIYIVTENKKYYCVSISGEEYIHEMLERGLSLTEIVSMIEL